MAKQKQLTTTHQDQPDIQRETGVENTAPVATAVDPRFHHLDLPHEMAESEQAVARGNIT